MTMNQIIFEKKKKKSFFQNILAYNPSTKVILTTFVSALFLSIGYLVITDAHFSPVLAKNHEKKNENRKATRAIARTETAIAKSQSRDTNKQKNRDDKHQRLEGKEERLLGREEKTHEKLQKIEYRQQKLDNRETQPETQITYTPPCDASCEQESQRALIRKREKKEIIWNDTSYQEKTVIKYHDTKNQCAYFSDEEKVQIRDWLRTQNLNRYGDPKDTAYAGGTPLFNEMTGQSISRYTYICMQYPDRPWLY